MPDLLDCLRDYAAERNSSTAERACGDDNRTAYHTLMVDLEVLFIQDEM